MTEKNCGACGQFFLQDEADEIGFHSAKFCDASEGTLLLEQKQFCLTCEELKELEQGEAVVRYGAFVEFTCYECKGAN